MESPCPIKRQKIGGSKTTSTISESQLLLQLSTLLNTRKTLEPSSSEGQKKCPRHQGQGQKFQRREHYFLADLVQQLHQDSENPGAKTPLKTDKLAKNSLLNYGTDVNLGICTAGLTLLHLVMTSDQLSSPEGQGVMNGQLLMELGTDVNLRHDDVNSCTALLDRLPMGTRDQNGDSSGSVDPELTGAIQGLHECLLKLLVHNEAEVNCRQEDCDPLHRTALQCHRKLVQILMKFGNQTNSGTSDQNSPSVGLDLGITDPVLDPVEEGSKVEDLTQMLLRAGSGVNSLRDNRSPLYSHFNQRLLHSLEFLLFNGASVNCFENKDLLKPSF